MKDSNIYPIDEAIKTVRGEAKAKFDESIEVHVSLGIDPRKGDQQVRGTVILPHGTGKTNRIAAFVSEAGEKEAKEAGAEIVGGENLISEIKKTGKCDFEVAIAEPAMMPKLAVIAKILGPKGLMPSPKNETITTNIKKTIEDLRKGKVNFKNDDTANIHQLIGKVSWDSQQIKENLEAFLEALKKAKPKGSKGTFFKGLTLCSTMGRGRKISAV